MTPILIASIFTSSLAFAGLTPVDPGPPGIKPPAVKVVPPKEAGWLLVTTKLYRLPPGFPSPQSEAAPVDTIREFDPEKVTITEHRSKKACLEAANDTLALYGDYAQAECIPKETK